MKKILPHIFLLLLATCSLAQEPISYTTKDGLPSNHIYDIQEDADGFMWFATNRGLVKFDGETFKTFTLIDGLPNNDTWLLELDYQGKLWYFSKSSYQGYIVNDSIYKFQTEDKKVITPRFNYKTKDSLWFFSNGGMQTVKKNEIKEIGFNSKYKSKVFNDKLLLESKKRDLETTSFAINPETRAFALLGQNELIFYDWDFNFITKVKHDITSVFNNLNVINTGLLYNQTYYRAFDTGVLYINFNTKTSKYIPYNKYLDVASTSYFKCKGLKNEIQISIPGHLLIFNYNLELIDSHSFPEVSKNRISYKDSKGNIWLGDFGGGVTLFPHTQLHSDYFLEGKKTQKLGVIEKQLIVGVSDDGFYKYSKTENRFKGFINDSSSANGEIYQISENPNYLITGQKSFSYNNNAATQIVIDDIDEYHKETHSFFKDIIRFKGETYYVGADYLINENQERTKILEVKNGMLIASEYKDKLYISGSDGLFMLQNDSLVKPLMDNDLLSTSILEMTATENNLWIGTDGRGVYCYDDHKVNHLKNTDGLSVQRIIKKDSFLWLATQNGVKKVALQEDDVENSPIIDAYYETDGLLQNNVNDIYLEDDTLYAASDIGLASLNLKNPSYKQTPQLYFKNRQDTLQFKDEERNNITLSFAALDFTNQEYLNYEYRLLPEQEEWVKTETKTINFSNLSPNFYNLEVKATDQHNNVIVIKQYIDVTPKWWQTKVATGFFWLLGILGLVAFAYIIKKTIQKTEQSKNEREKQIAGLELQALRSQMNPHFVHNSLNAIQYYIQRNEVELSENYLSKFSKLIRLFFEYSRKQSISLIDEVQLLTHYLEIEKMRFEEKLTYNLHIDPDMDLEEYLIPSMILQPIVENSVNHGIFHKTSNGTIDLHFQKLPSNNSFAVVIEDDGIGIEKAKKLFKSSSKNYQSSSSAVLAERLQLLEQSDNWEITYQIKDLSLEKNRTGTRVKLTFKKFDNE